MTVVPTLEWVKYIPKSTLTRNQWNSLDRYFKKICLGSPSSQPLLSSWEVPGLNPLARNSLVVGDAEQVQYKC